jgi:transposase
MLTPTCDPPLFGADPHSHSHLTLFTRVAIIVMFMLGFSKPRIVHWIGHDQRTIDHWIRHYQQTGDVADEQRIGRPHSLDDEKRQEIIDLAEEKKFITPKEIGRELEVDVSARTIRRILDAGGLSCRVARISYPFTDDHIRQRLEFVETYGKWTAAEWGRVLYSDETYIHLGLQGRVWVQRPEDKAFDPEYVAGTAALPTKIGIWGCFSAQGIGPYKFIVETLNARELTDIYNTKMKPTALQLWPLGPWYSGRQKNFPHFLAGQNS